MANKTCDECGAELAFDDNWSNYCADCRAEAHRRKTRPVGAPNSIARYVHGGLWGRNTFATFEYVDGMPVVRAAGNYDHCMHYMAENRCIVDVKRCWIVWPKRDQLDASINSANSSTLKPYSERV